MKRRIFFIALFVAVVGALAWFVLRSREPVYGGRRLGYWLNNYLSTYWVGATNEALRAPAEDALRHIGTNAIPTLLRMLRAKDSTFALKIMQLLERQNLIANPFIPAGEKNMEAAFDFNILGAEAKSAVPELIQIFEENISEFSRLETAEALGAIGPEAKPAIPVLLRYVTSTNYLVNTKARVLTALGQIHSEPDTVLPVILGCLKDANLIVQISAIRGIGDFGANARQALPALLAEATNTNSRARGAAIFALKKIDPEAAAKVGEK